MLRPRHLAVAWFLMVPLSATGCSGGDTGIADSDGYHLFYCSYFCNAGGEYYYSWSAGDLGACNIMDVVTGIG